jgi:hypothetical protein
MTDFTRKIIDTNDLIIEIRDIKPEKKTKNVTTKKIEIKEYAAIRLECGHKIKKTKFNKIPKEKTWCNHCERESNTKELLNHLDKNNYFWGGTFGIIDREILREKGFSTKYVKFKNPRQDSTVKIITKELTYRKTLSQDQIKEIEIQEYKRMEIASKLDL